MVPSTNIMLYTLDIELNCHHDRNTLNSWQHVYSWRDRQLMSTNEQVTVTHE